MIYSIEDILISLFEKRDCIYFWIFAQTDGLPTGHRMRKIILTRAQLGHTSKPRYIIGGHVLLSFVSLYVCVSNFVSFILFKLRYGVGWPHFVGKYRNIAPQIPNSIKLFFMMPVITGFFFIDLGYRKWSCKARSDRKKSLLSSK